MGCDTRLRMCCTSALIWGSPVLPYEWTAEASSPPLRPVVGTTNRQVLANVSLEVLSEKNNNNLPEKANTHLGRSRQGRPASSAAPWGRTSTPGASAESGCSLCTWLCSARPPPGAAARQEVDSVTATHEDEGQSWKQEATQ